MLYKLIYNLNGSQYLAEVYESGGLCEDAEILWDERLDGPLDESLLQYVGCLIKDGDDLRPDLTVKDQLDEAAAIAAAQELARQQDIDDCYQTFLNINSVASLDDLKKCVKSIAYQIGVL